MSVEIIFSEPFFFFFLYPKTKVDAEDKSEISKRFPWGWVGQGIGLVRQQHTETFSDGFNFLSNAMYSSSNQNNLQFKKNTFKWLTFINLKCVLLMPRKNFQCLLFFFFHMLMLYFGMKLLISTYSGHFCSGCFCRFSIAYLIVYSSTRRGLRPNNLLICAPHQLTPNGPSIDWNSESH